MNKLLMVLLIGLSSLKIFGQDIEFSDSKFKEKLLLLGIDTNGDNEINVDEAKPVNKIDIAEPYLESPILNISGVEYFVNLDTFICVSHELKNVDLNKNSNLQYIDLRGNYGLNTLIIDSLFSLNTLKITGIGYEIDSIKLSNFSELKELEIDYKSGLDVSYNTNLEILSAYHIDNIDVTNNLKLKKLTCNNQTSLDLSNNIELEYLSCIAYAYSDTAPKLDELNLSNNLNLKELECSQNNITSLDLSNNIKLETFHGSNNPFGNLDLTYNTNLQWFRCSVCNLDTLDLSKNTELTYLHCHYNNLKLLDLSNNRKLEYLYCNINHLDSLNVSNCAELKRLDCSNNSFEELDLCSNSKLEWIQMVEIQNLKNVHVWTIPFPPENLWLNDWGCPVLNYVRCGTSISDVIFPDIKIHPNPVYQELQIENYTGKKLSLKIIDINGRTIYEQPLNDVKSIINFNAPPSVYSVLITNEMGEKMLEQKIVKQ